MRHRQVTSSRLGADAEVSNPLFPKTRSWFALGAPLELLSPLSVVRLLFAEAVLTWPLLMLGLRLRGADADVLVLTTPFGHRAAAEAALERGVHVVSVSDDMQEVRGLLALDAEARERAVSVVIGAALGSSLRSAGPLQAACVRQPVCASTISPGA